MRDRKQVVDAVIGSGVVAVLRTDEPQDLDWLAGVLHSCGVNALEVTMTVPDAIEQIRGLADRFGPGHLVGVGSVLSVAQAERAMDAGAAYVVSPVFQPDIVRAVAERDVPVVPGCFSPTEIHRASELGADIIKVFPADTLGMAFFRGVLAPMPHLKLMPTGGVTCENAGDWIRAGAVTVGIGGSLLHKDAIADRDEAKLRQRVLVLQESISWARTV